MFNGQYIPQRGYNQQNMYEQIDNQINQLNQMREQLKNNANQQPAINQTFQLAPSNHTMKYANTIDDVNKEVVYYETPFFSKDMSVLWVKDTKGNVKTYELNEIIPKDSKDLIIENLQLEIEELKGMIKNEPNVTNDDAEFNEPSTTEDVGEIRTTTKTSKPTSIPRVSTSKKK